MPPPTKNIVPKLLPWSVRVNQPLPVRVPLTTRATAIAENAEERAREKKENLGELIYINDPRKIRRTTGQPLKPTERRGGKVSKKLITEIIGYAKKYNIDPNEAVARAIIESEGNPSYNNPFHILYNPENPETNPHGSKVMGSYASGVEAGLVFVKQKEDEFNRLVKKGKISPENRDLLRLQIYNGLGKLFPDTEGAKGWMYGVKIPEEGLKMTDNPLYAKELLDIVDIVKANSEIQSIVKSTQPTKTTTQYGPLKNKVYVEPKEFGKGGEVKNNKYSSIPRTGLRYPNIVRLPSGQRSFYDPVEETIYLADGEDPTVVQHEMFHHWQKLNNNLSVGPTQKPPITAENPWSYYNRRQADIEDASSKFFKKNPSFLNIPFDLVFNKEVDPAMYYYPEYAEGEAEEYQNYINQGGEPVFPSYAKGGLIKRKDGSYSKRGLWDNIRANRGSGRRPTKEMLRQERKIRAAEKKEDGGPVYNWIPPNYPRVGARNEHGGWLDQYEYGGSIEDQRIPTPAQYEFGLKYADNNSPTLTTNQMGTPRAYAHGATVFTKQTTPAWVAGTPTPTTTQREIAFNRSFSPGTAVPYPEVRIPASAYTPASPPVLQGYNPYNGPMRLHAPDTTQIARNGGQVTSKYKKRAGIPYAISPGVSNAGMYVGPTTQRGITFANGGWLDTYATGEEETQAGPTVSAAAQLATKPYFSPAVVQSVLAKANQPVTTTTGRVISTPETREKERREKIIAEDPSKYTIRDYEIGIKEPGAGNSVVDDPLALAAAATAGGVALGAYGLSQVPRMFLGNLASEATAGLSNLGKFVTTKTPLKNAYKINPKALKEADLILTRTQKPGQSSDLKVLKQLEEWGNKYGFENMGDFALADYKRFSRPGYGRGFSSNLTDIGYYSNPNIQQTRGYEGLPEILKIRLPAKEAAKFNVGKKPLQGYTSYAPNREYLLPEDLVYSAESFIPTVAAPYGPGTVYNFIKTLDTEQQIANTPHWWRGYPSKKNGGWLDTYEDGGETTSSLINQALNEARPQASTTSTNVSFVTQALNTAFNQEQDYLKLSEEAFQQKYGKGKHKYKYDTDPTYKAEVDKHVKAVEKSGQPVVKKTVKVNPNLMFMVPSRGYTPETAQNLVNANLETIGTVLPVPGLEAVGKIPSLLSVASKAVAPIKAGIKEGVGIYKDYYQLNKLFNQQHDVQTQLNNLYHPLHGDETSPFMQTRLAEYHLKKKYDAYQSRKYPYFSSTFDFTGSPKGVLSSSTMPAFADLDRAIEVRSKQLLEEQKLQGMGAKASNDIITYRTPTPLVYATKHGKGNMINLKTGEVVPVSVEPAGETINFSKTGEVAVNGYKPSFINPNLKNTLKDNIDWVENASGGKVFGSARGVADVNLPHLPNDLEVLITRDDYNTKVAGKIGKVSKEGKAITHSLDNNAGDFDFVIIDADNKGFATGDRAAELFRQFDPDAYFEASRKALKEGKPMIIPYTPKQLLDKVDPKVKTVMDAMEIDATNIIKQKHVNRPDAYIAYGDPAIVEEAQTKFIQALVGKKGKVAPTFDPAEFSNPEKNLRILEEIGFKGDVQAIIKDPKRMQLAINDYYINTTVLSRGVRKVHSNTGKKLTLEEVEQAFKVWDPEAGGGMMRGAGQNHVVLGKSGEYDFYGHKQIGLDLPTNNVENFVTSLKKQTDGLGKLSDEERNAAKDILAAYADNDRYKNIIPGTADDFINAVAGGVPKDKMKEALAKFSEATGKKVTITSDYGNSLYASTLKDFDETLDALEFNVSNQVPTPTSRTSRQYAMADPNSFSVDPAILALNRKTQDQFKLLYNKINDGVNKTSERLEKLKATHKNLYDALFNPEKEKARIKAVSRARNKELYEKLDKVEAEIVERTKTLDALKSRIAKAQKYSNAIQLGSVGIAAAIAVPIFDKASDAFSEWQRKGIDRRAKRIRELKARRNKKGLQNPPNKPTSNTNSGWLDTLQTK